MSGPVDQRIAARSQGLAGMLSLAASGSLSVAVLIGAISFSVVAKRGLVPGLLLHNGVWILGLVLVAWVHLWARPVPATLATIRRTSWVLSADLAVVLAASAGSVVSGDSGSALVLGGPALIVVGLAFALWWSLRRDLQASLST